MHSLPFHRRQFLQSAAIGSAVAVAAPSSLLADKQGSGKAPFQVSLAEWSLHKAIQGKKLTNLDFPRVAKEEFGIDAIEYVNQFFKDKARDKAYLDDVNKRCADYGVKSVLIMVDGEGALGDQDETKRAKAVENHLQWLEAAKHLGCHSIRVNAQSSGEYAEQQKLAADGLRRLSEAAQPLGLNVIVENHGGLSSNGEWLSGVMKLVGLPNCGTLPDFGNFRIKQGEEYDRYKGVDELMPFAKAVSAKSYDFDAAGNETTIDFPRMMDIVLKHNYHGYVGIEYEGNKLDEFAGIKATKALLDKIAVAKA
jgi:sugar phosphate isomerase/epimerase